MAAPARGRLGFFGKGIHHAGPPNTGAGDFGFDGSGSHHATSASSGTGRGDFGFEGLGQPAVHATNTGAGDFGFGAVATSSSYAWTVDIENVDGGGDGEFPTCMLQISQTSPGEPPSWLTIDNLEGQPRAKAWASFIGRTGELDDVSPGTGSIVLDNRGGVFDPDNAASPIFALLTTGRRIRVVATFGELTVTAFDQYVEEWPQDDDPTMEWREVTVGTLDALSPLAQRTFMPARPFTPDDPILGVLDTNNVFDGPPHFDEQTSGERIRQILDLLAIPYNAADVNVGYSLLAPDDPTDKVLPVLQQIARSEPGLLYATADGRLRFVQRDAQPPNPLIVFTDNLDQQAGEPYDDITVDRSKALIKNRVTRTTAAGLTFTANDADSQTLYGTVEDSKTDLLNANETDLIGMCQYVIARYSGNVARVTALVVDAAADPEVLFPFVLAAELGWKITVGRTPKIGGPIVLRDCVIDSIATTVAAPMRWSVALGLIEADSAHYFTPDDALLGRLDADNVFAF